VFENKTNVRPCVRLLSVMMQQARHSMLRPAACPLQLMTVPLISTLSSSLNSSISHSSSLAFEHSSFYSYNQHEWKWSPTSEESRLCYLFWIIFHCYVIKLGTQCIFTVRKFCLISRKKFPSGQFSLRLQYTFGKWIAFISKCLC